jgi:hypothetical protein
VLNAMQQQQQHKIIKRYLHVWMFIASKQSVGNVKLKVKFWPLWTLRRRRIQAYFYEWIAAEVKLAPYCSSESKLSANRQTGF